MVKAIVFDFVGVLLYCRPDYQPTPVVEAIDAVIGRVTDDAQFKAETLRKHELSETAFDRVLQVIVEKYVPFQPLWDLLPELRKHFKLAIINNGTWLTYSRFNARFNLEHIFNQFISSALEGIAKPDERIYQRTCHKLGLLANECLYMDDAIENVMAAQRIGMQGIHWSSQQKGFEQFVEYIRDYEIWNLPA